MSSEVDEPSSPDDDGRARAPGRAGRTLVEDINRDIMALREYMIFSERDVEIEFEPRTLESKPPTRHGEYESLELLGQVYHVASGGAALTTTSTRSTLDPSVLAQFKSPILNNALHVAALCGWGDNDDLVDRVARQDPELVFSFNKNLETPLHVATRVGHIPTLRKLLGHACVDSNSVTRVVDLMKKKSAYNRGNSLLHVAMMGGGGGGGGGSNNKMGSMIFHVLEAYTIVDNSGRTLAQSCYELALNNVNDDRRSALYLAVEAGLKETVDQILEHCPESATPKGISPLAAAIMKRDKEMLNIILRKKKEWMHLVDLDKRLPIHWAASTGYLEGVDYLLDACETCSIQRDKYGFLPLHLAAHKGHVEVVKTLLGYCPNHNEMLDRLDRNILHIGAKGGKLELVRYILQNPELEKMINQKSFMGETPLHLATASNRPMVVYALTWDRRVDLNLLNHKNQTALDIAIQKQRQNPVPLLRQLLTWVALKSGGAKQSPSKPASSTPEQSAFTGTEKYKDRVDSLSVISTLIVTASVAACLAVPGEADGTANNLHKFMFHFFIFCITISLFSSISGTIILIWGKLGLIELLNFSIKLASPLLGAALITLSLAFLAGVYTVISKLTWLATTFVVITSIWAPPVFNLSPNCHRFNLSIDFDFFLIGIGKKRES